MRSLYLWAFGRPLIGALAVIALASCGQTTGAPQDWANDPRTTTDAHSRQVDLDVLAIVTGMALAHGGRVVALMPER